MLIDESLYPMIFKRRSFHLFRNIAEEKIDQKEINDICEAFETFIRLYPDIKTTIRIVPEEETTRRRGADLCVMIFSEVRSGYLQNVGYIGEQLDLYLTSRNIGTLWYGMGKTTESTFEELQFVIMIAIAKVYDEGCFRKDMFKSKRKPIECIWQGEPIEGVSEIVRFAPSSCNTQPWKVVHSDDFLGVYRYKEPGKHGIMPARLVNYFNRIDIGIFIYFMDLCLTYNGTAYDRKNFIDDGGNDEMTLVARYSLGQ